MVENTIQVRIASSADNILLAELGGRTFSETFAPDNAPEDMALYLAASFSPEKQAAELTDSKTTFLIAGIASAQVGYARLRLGLPPYSMTGTKPIEIVRLYAATPWIGLGVGAALMTSCLEIARSKGCDTIWLDVWERNSRAIAFYQKWSFEIVGTQSFQLGRDVQRDYLMQRLVVAG